MTTLELSGMILAGEFALVSWTILFIMLRRHRQRMHEDHAHAGAVIRHLETEEVSRRDAIANLFESTYRLEGEELASKVDEYVAREKAFYNAMLSLYLSRDGARLQEIPKELTKVLTPWANMTPTGMIHASDVSDLESEKAALAAELDSTKDTLEQLMDEYMAAFKKQEAKAEEEETPEPEPEPEPAKILDESVATEEAAVDAFDAGDFDVRSEGEVPEAFEPQQADTEVAPAKPAPDVPPEPGPTAEPEPAAAEDSIDQAELDAMLDAFGAETRSAPASPEPGPAPEAAAPDEEEARAREELEGLADLFGDTDNKP